MDTGFNCFIKGNGHRRGNRPRLAALRVERKALEAALATMRPLMNVVPPIIDVTGRLAVLIGTDVFPQSRGDIVGSGGALPPFPTPAKCALSPPILRMTPARALLMQGGSSTWYPGGP